MPTNVPNSADAEASLPPFDILKPEHAKELIQRAIEDAGTTPLSNIEVEPVPNKCQGWLNSGLQLEFKLSTFQNATKNDRGGLTAAMDVVQPGTHLDQMHIKPLEDKGYMVLRNPERNTFTLVMSPEKEKELTGPDETAEPAQLTKTFHDQVEGAQQQ